MSRAAIISADRDICRFFELELYMLGHAVEVHKSMNSVLHNVYDVIIADAQAVKRAELDSFECTVAVIATDNGDRCEDGKIFLPWPVPIEDIRKLFDSISEKGADIQKNTPHIQVGVYNTAYTVDINSGTLSVGNRYIKLSKNELYVLRILCDAGGKVVEREVIMNVLGAEKGNIADVYICSLRKKLEGEDGQRLIFTERGKGYRTTLRLV